MSTDRDALLSTLLSKRRLRQLSRRDFLKTAGIIGITGTTLAVASNRNLLPAFAAQPIQPLKNARAQVTLDIFSGRPNPSWSLTPKDAQKLMESIAGKVVHSPVDAHNGLGYRSFIISLHDEHSSNALQTFRVGGTLSSHPSQEATIQSQLQQSESDEIGLWLLSTAEDRISDRVRQHAEQAIKGNALKSHELSSASASILRAKDEDLVCTVNNVPYDPDFWNREEVQEQNNCYNYAMDYRSDTFAQPGRISGEIPSQFRCSDYTHAALADGCVISCEEGTSYRNVALVIWPDEDYHWYCQHKEGFWAHKPGHSTVRNTDNSHKLISGELDPESCDRGPYTDFCGYFLSPKGMQVQ